LSEHDASQTIECNSTADLKVNEYIKLGWQQTNGQGLKEELITAGLSVRFRQGGEKIQLPNQLHHKSLKHLFQEWGVPPWQRDRIPLFFQGDRLVAVMGYAINNKSSVIDGEQGYLPELKSY